MYDALMTLMETSLNIMGKLVLCVFCFNGVSSVYGINILSLDLRRVFFFL